MDYGHLKGQKFGRLEVLGVSDVQPAKGLKLRCICTCGRQTDVRQDALLAGDTKSCGCLRRKRGLFGPYGTVEYGMLERARWRAKKYGLSFNLTINDIHIPSICPLLGIPLRVNRGTTGTSSDNSPSLDRINSENGYTRDNIWVISQKANRIKSDLTVEQMSAMVMGWRCKLSSKPPNTGKLIYLASPYTHIDKQVEAQRYAAVLAAWKWLIDNHSDLHFFVPIVQSHQLCVLGGLPGDWKFWADFDSTMISKCAEFWVFCGLGFSQSVGVNAERGIAAEYGLPIRFLVPINDGYEITVDEPKA
jgi:hypothetical protein